MPAAEGVGDHAAQIRRNLLHASEQLIELSSADHAVDERLIELAALKWLDGQPGIHFMFPSEKAFNVSNGEGWAHWEPLLVNGKAKCTPREALENHAAFREGRAPLFYGGTLVWCEPTDRGFRLRQEPNQDFIRVALGEYSEGGLIDRDTIRSTPVGKAAADAGYPAESDMWYWGERDLTLPLSRGPTAARVFARTPICGKPWTENVEDQVMFLLAMDLEDVVLPMCWVQGKPVEVVVAPAKLQRPSGEQLTIVPTVEWLGVVDLPGFLHTFRSAVRQAYDDKLLVWSVNPIAARSKHHFHCHGMVKRGKISPIFGAEGVGNLLHLPAGVVP